MRPRDNRVVTGLTGSAARLANAADWPEKASAAHESDGMSFGA
jgi:hypothetical protein